MEERICDERSGEWLTASRELAAKLPEYQMDETGGLKEWSLPQMHDNHEHRHISHLYCAWPGVETQHNVGLAESCRQAIRNRNVGNAEKNDTALSWLDPQGTGGCQTEGWQEPGRNLAPAGAK